MAEVLHRTLVFDRFILDMTRGCLYAGEQDIGLRPKTYNVLRYLAENAGRLVSKEELYEVIWPNVVVSDDSLVQCIRELRQRLGDAEHCLIKTVARRGYLLDTQVSSSNAKPKQVSHPTKSNKLGGSEPSTLSSDARPSIAVLPFLNLSDDPDQEFLADGIVEDVITELSRFRSLFVIARSSTFTYKGRVVDVAKVARELGVRYVVEGSVRKANNRVRITAQLIDAASGKYLWADRFHGSLDDVFDLQDRITEKIVVAVEPEIGARERQRARRKAPENLDAWELLQRGLSHFYRVNAADRAVAIRLFKEAIAIDPEFAAAYANLAYALWPSRSVTLKHSEDAAEAMASARAAAEQAISLDPNEPMAHFALGRLHVYNCEAESAIAEMQKAIAINPNFALGHYGLGFAYHTGTGQMEKALPYFDAALRLNPQGPLRWAALMMKGSALRVLDRHNEAVVHCRQACQVPDCGIMPYVHLAAALAETGQKSEAQAVVKTAMQLQPALSLSILRSQFKGMHKTTLNSLLDSLRKAGVPE